MSDLTRVLDAVGRGQVSARDLLPLVYDELRRIAAHQMAQESKGHTLQPTALVHEAWIRLVGQEDPQFDGRAHFFAAAAESMRRILVDSARRRQSLKRGAGAVREELEDLHLVQDAPSDEIIAVDDALDQLAAEDAAAADLVKLRYFVGMSMEEAATAMGLPLRTAERRWSYARAWLRRCIANAGKGAGPGPAE